MSGSQQAARAERIERMVPDSRQVVWLMSLRVVIITTLLLSALLVQVITESYFSALNPIYYLVGSTYLLTLVYAAIHSTGRWRRWFVYAQLLGDLLIITGLIYYSGGIDSAFPFLYILTIITASILVLRRGGILMALVACVLYGALVALIYNGVVAPPTGFLASPQTLTVNQVYYNLFVRWIGFVAAALLSSYLAEKLRETGETLEERSADLAKLQVFYEDIINSVNSGLVATDLEGRIGSVNHAGERILGSSFAALRGQRIQDLLKIGGLGTEELQHAGAEGRRFEVRYHAPDGTRRFLGVSAAPLQDRASQQRGYALVVQDLTLLKELEREVRLKDRMAAIGEMAAGMAHEIRNPLASMSGSIQVLQSDLSLEGEQQSLMQIVLTESERLNRIIEEFLFYARPQPPLPQPVDLGVLVEQSVTLFRNSPELSRRHQVEWRLVGGDLLVEADLDQLRQVLWNLLRNAAQAMPDGGHLLVTAGPRERDGVLLSVEDEGPGFAEEMADRLWEPFHGSTTKGTGLGLALVYRIVREHGGRISIQNRAPRGAHLSIWLPCSWARGEDLRPDPFAAQAGGLP